MKCILKYNKRMGTIDHQDQMLFPNYEKSHQRILKTFFYMSDIALFNTYIMHKTLRAKFGVKAFVLIESRAKYIFNFELYTGILDLLHQRKTLFFWCFSILFLDTWYSFPTLDEKLHKNHTTICGTVRIRRKGMPRDEEFLKNIKSLEKG
ncbi:hypothetical protein HZH66_012897 [Vespula vulgaris]|uniref:PiggyBac transposable element-derived protein domain-containing protein n=1 Tax=Vespula vulgaris TaxID=7454 RepID=A0A834JAD2_VESVU|nr:hypothetical protein HZH66_012897 [Vespula vulgaris]